LISHNILFSTLPGDLSKEIDRRVKESVAAYAGKDRYEPGDLTRAVAQRVQSKVEEFTGKEYAFGDISRELNRRREEWVKDFLGEEAAANYKFGDITKKAVTSFTGKEVRVFGVRLLCSTCSCLWASAIESSLTLVLFFAGLSVR
jgi:hypothetical protein